MLSFWLGKDFKGGTTRSKINGQPDKQIFKHTHTHTNTQDWRIDVILF